MSDLSVKQIKSYPGDIKDGLRLYLQITKAQNINFYLYSGPKSDTLRYHANETVVPENVSPTIGQNYTLDIKKGFLLIAYPNENEQGSISFKYWLAPYSMPWYERLLTLNFEGSAGQQLFNYSLIALGILTIIILCCGLYCLRKYCCSGSSNKVSDKVEFTNELVNQNRQYKTSTPITPDDTRDITDMGQENYTARSRY